MSLTHIVIIGSLLLAAAFCFGRASVLEWGWTSATITYARFSGLGS